MHACKSCTDDLETARSKLSVSRGENLPMPIRRPPDLMKTKKRSTDAGNRIHIVQTVNSKCGRDQQNVYSNCQNFVK
jgi:hypothetical protein